MLEMGFEPQIRKIMAVLQGLEAATKKQKYVKITVEDGIMNYADFETYFNERVKVFSEFYATHISREIDFDASRRSKTVIFAFLKALNLQKVVLLISREI